MIEKRIEDLSNSVFDLADEIELACKNEKEREKVVIAIIERCALQPEFRQDLLDLELVPIITRNIDWENLPKLVGRNRNMKSALKNETEKLSVQLHLWLMDSENHEHWSSIITAALSLCKCCAVNKQLILKQDTISLIITRLEEGINIPLLQLFTTLISDDDKESRNPAHVFARDQALETSNLDKLRLVFRLYRETRHDQHHIGLLLTISRELSVSQPTARIFAVEENFLLHACSLLRDDENNKYRTAAARYLRQVSFSDDLKTLVLETLMESRALYEWLHMSFGNELLCVHLFSTLANITLKAPDLSLRILNMHPDLFSLTKKVLTVPQSSEVTSCMQFMRSFVKTSEGREILNESFTTVLHEVRISGNDASKKAADEILHRLCK